MERFTAIGIGEMLWDMLPEGKKLGGAPSNFAFQFNALGGYGVPFSRLGDDDLGKEARALLESHGVDTAIVGTDPDHPSGRVDVTVDADGVPSYIFPPDVAWDFIKADAAALEMASRANAASFGTLAQRSEVSRASIRTFIDAMPGNALRILDINLRQHFYTAEVIDESLDIANVLKINDEELLVIAEFFGLNGSQEEMMRSLLKQYSLELCALTRGGEGSLLMTPDEVSDHTGVKTTIVDTIGAGDAFTAALCMGILQEQPLGTINERANELAAFVCSQPGAQVVRPL